MPELISGLDVSRETMDALTHYAALLEKWTRKINLIAPDSVATIWQRHIVDSAQLFSYIPAAVRTYADLGSGGGLPAVVLAILFKEVSPLTKTTMIESDVRKSTFLRTAIRELDLNAEVIAKRIDDVMPRDVDLVTARALAPLPQLLAYVSTHLSKSGAALLPKGQNHAAEVAAASQDWHFSLKEHISLTNPDARILEIGDISRAKS